jgi:Flp pilus assembly protein TadB
MDYTRLIVLFAVLGSMAAIGLAAIYLQRRREERELQADRRMAERRLHFADRRAGRDRRGPERQRHDEAHNLERRDGERRLGERRGTRDWVNQYRELRRRIESEPTREPPD